MTKRTVALLAGATLVASGGAAALVALAHDSDNAPNGPAGMSRALSGELPAFSYPEEWDATYTDAKSIAKFSVLDPSTPDANAENVTHTYASPNGSVVVMQFPIPKDQVDSSVDVRLRTIEVYETPRSDKDEAAINEADLQKNPSESKSYCDVGGIQGICMTPRSKSDEFQANPAFLRFATGGVEVQVYGGDSLKTLISIAESMLAESSK